MGGWVTVARLNRRLSTWRKGGAPEETVGRKCVCNGLLSTIGIGQVRAHGELEPALVTAGDDARRLGRFLPGDRRSYTAADVLRYLLSGVTVTPA